MNLHRYLFYMAGQVGLMVLIRFFLQWINYFSATLSAEGHVFRWLRQCFGGMQFQSTGADVDALFSLGVVGTLLLAFRIFDGVTDPLAGVFSDAWIRRGYERRRLLLVWIAVPAVGLVLVFWPDHTMSATLRWGLLVSGMFILFVGYTFYGIPYWSLIADYSGGVEKTGTILSSLLGLGALIATGIGFVATPLMVEHLGFTTTAILLAGPAMILMILPYFAAPASARGVASDSQNATGIRLSPKIVVDALKDRNFMAVVVLFAGSHMSFTVMTAAAPFLAVNLLGGTESDVARLLGPLLVVAIPCFVFVPRVSMRFGWRKSIAAAAASLAVVYGSTAALGQSIIGGPMTTAMAIFAAGGPMVAILLGLEGEAITRCAQRAGGEVVSVYFGVFNFVTKAMNGLAILVAGYLSALGILAASDAWLSGAVALRAMSLVAGGFLVFGVVGYYIVKPQSVSDDKTATLSR